VNFKDHRKHRLSFPSASGWDRCGIVAVEKIDAFPPPPEAHRFEMHHPPNIKAGFAQRIAPRVPIKSMRDRKRWWDVALCTQSTARRRRNSGFAAGRNLRNSDNP
jgi:hypothetical protein